MPIIEVKCKECGYVVSELIKNVNNTFEMQHIHNCLLGVVRCPNCNGKFYKAMSETGRPVIR